MNHLDMEMMETESTMNSAQNTSAPSNTATTGNNHDHVIRELLTSSRRLISQGKPSQALQAVVMAVRANGGDGAVFQTLHRARELYRNKLQANIAADQLASLFAECAIAEAQSTKFGRSPHDMSTTSMAPEAYESSILAETGRNQIVLDAFSDGSSFICLQCGGLVSNHRKDEHCAYWCC
ncbi:hypothetical protein RJ641_029173 [Dillenia turbinata]|uniref:C2HC zinc finger plants domain-containing protein n=1 Tax=Dillenia turbinata TaxID=194707 RepID=A0AAN8W5Q1_9MAGN